MQPERVSLWLRPPKSLELIIREKVGLCRFLISILGLTVGASQTLGSLLVVVGGAWIAWTVWLRSNGTETRPRVR